MVTLPLLHMAYTDLRDRHIHGVAWLVFLVLTVLHLMFQTSTTSSVAAGALNLALVALILGISVLVMHWKRGLKPSRMIGKGDLLFFIPGVFWLDTIHFIFWFNITLIGSVLLHWALGRLAWYQQKGSVPLAGFFSLSLLIFLWVDNTGWR